LAEFGDGSAALRILENIPEVRVRVDGRTRTECWLVLSEGLRRNEVSSMKWISREPFANEKGLAMVLAVSFIALLSTLAIWLILESKSNVQTTKAYERTEATNRLAESACWLAVHYMDGFAPALPTTGGNATLSDVTPSGVGYLQANQDLGGGRLLTPKIWTGRDFYNTVPPEGWSLNEPARYYTKFYIGRGLGVMPISSARGSARSRVLNFVTKIAR
jgi:hypothetical protein